MSSSSCKHTECPLTERARIIRSYGDHSTFAMTMELMLEHVRLNHLVRYMDDGKTLSVMQTQKTPHDRITSLKMPLYESNFQLLSAKLDPFVAMVSGSLNLSSKDDAALLFPLLYESPDRVQQLASLMQSISDPRFPVIDSVVPGVTINDTHVFVKIRGMDGWTRVPIHRVRVIDNAPSIVMLFYTPPLVSIHTTDINHWYVFGPKGLTSIESE